MRNEIVEYKTKWQCKVCRNEEIWFINTDETDRLSIIDEAWDCMERTIDCGYRCEHCNNQDYDLLDISLSEED